ncbi:hypothetical protein FIE12Z_1210 [Fusarium flagelliforme]|uniref:Uncharacterized protein n=1 Tax=Fusarium flagelliforme TaxID=2675880 RepID=A0A395N2R6_9HYPO|nr:hypothetical protein FIE12Z_1210 [Fusarium flagelliforme]
MDERPTPISDIALQCLESFDRIVEEYDYALLTKVIVPKDRGTGRPKKPLRRDTFYGLRHRFLDWAKETRALSLLDSLDERLRGLKDVSAMVTQSLVDLAKLASQWVPHETPKELTF